MSRLTERYGVPDLPTGESGDWRVERFTVSEEAAKFQRLRAMFGGRGRGVPAGTYTRLTRNGTVVMSDTPDEIRDHLGFIRRAKGRVLINGLGLGVCLDAVARKETVEHVTVVEISEDVIRLVGPHYERKFGDKIQIELGDALVWKPPQEARYDSVWHDIWDDICADNLPEMHRLHRRYGRRSSWQGSWARELCERQREQWRSWDD